MDVIPVLDLKRGRAVHARGGDRSRYETVRGVLGSGDDPVALATAFRDRVGCTALYVADLDAIGGDQPFTPRSITHLANTGLTLLVDAGVRTADEAIAVRNAGAAHIVVALETVDGFETLAEIGHACGSARTVFSLDLRDGMAVAANGALARLDPVTLACHASDAGAGSILVLDLDRVGSDAGPSLTILEQVRGVLPGVPLLAGGGVRDGADLDALAALGCVGALVASALHTGRIDRSAVERCRTTPVATPGSAPPDRSSPRPPS